MAAPAGAAAAVASSAACDRPFRPGTAKRAPGFSGSRAYVPDENKGAFPIDVRRTPLFDPCDPGSIHGITYRASYGHGCPRWAPGIIGLEVLFEYTSVIRGHPLANPAFHAVKDQNHGNAKEIAVADEFHEANGSVSD